MDVESTMHAREILGRGRTAEIFAWGEGRALKLYRQGSHRSGIRREAEVSRRVHRAGLPAPAVYAADTEDGLVEIEGRLGIVYDRIDGITMLHDLGRHPWRALAHARSLAELHARLHTVDGAGLPRLRDRLERSLAHARGTISEEALEMATGRLRTFPEGDRLCHGDFHPDNVLLTARGPVIIDWGPATQGHPAADVAWTILLFRYAGVPPGTPRGIRLLLAGVRRLMLRTYLRTYGRAAGLSRREIEPWLLPVAILRLADGISEERAALRALISRELRTGRT